MTQLPPQDPAFPASIPPPPPPPPGQAPPLGQSAPPGPPPGFGNAPPPAGGFGGPPPAPGKKKNTPLIIVLGVLVAAFVVIGGIALFAGGDDDTDDDTAGSNSGGTNTEAEAEDVVLEFIDAEVDEDCDAMVGLMSSRFLDARGGESDAVDACVSEYEGYGGVTYEADSLKMTSSGDETVTFEAEETLGGEQYEATYNLVQEDGKWRIDSLS